MGKTPELNATQRSRVLRNDEKLLGLAIKVIDNKALRENRKRRRDGEVEGTVMQVRRDRAQCGSRQAASIVWK